MWLTDCPNVVVAPIAGRFRGTRSTGGIARTYPGGRKREPRVMMPDLASVYSFMIARLAGIGQASSEPRGDGERLDTTTEQVIEI